MTSCGGRENCGKRFCITGIVNDYLAIFSIISGGFIATGIALFVFGW
jgi:hypothetical protein